MKEIEKIIDKYFEGETSAAEEKELRRFFATDTVPEHLEVYRPLFAYFDEEIEKQSKNHRLAMPNRRKVFLWVSGVAATILLLLGLGQRYIFPGQVFCSGDYVVINGRCYTDRETIRQHAFQALQEVSTLEQELFPRMMDEEEADRELIENQLKELGEFFLDDE